MDRLQQRLELANKALATLEEVLRLQEPTKVERDATIQRFEYSFEAQWKLGKQFLREVEGIDIGSPKGVIRYCHEVGLFDSEETISALEMVDDRNLTSHTYNEELAEEIFRKIPAHAVLMRKWWERINKRFLDIR